MRTLAATVFLALFSTFSVAQEAPPNKECPLHQELFDHLIGKGGTPVTFARDAQGNILTIWTNGKEWTAVLSNLGSGRSCPVTGGRGISVNPEKPICIDPIRCPRV